MGRKKSNARPVERGRKIHVNKYINQRGKTKSHRRSETPCKLTSKKPQFHEFPADQWPATKIPKQYEIWFAELGNHYGTSVQSGNRPVLVISNDMANKNSDVVTVIPLTSQMKRIELPTHCIIHDLLDEDSVVLAEQITAIPKWRLHRKLCSCTDEVQVSEIERAVKVQLGLEDETNE